MHSFYLIMPDKIPGFFTDLKPNTKNSTCTVHCISAYIYLNVCGVSRYFWYICTGWHCYLGHPVIPVLTPARHCQHLQCTERSDAQPINEWPQSDQPFQDRLSLYFRVKINCVLILHVLTVKISHISHKLALYTWYMIHVYIYILKMRAYIDIIF